MALIAVYAVVDGDASIDRDSGVDRPSRDGWWLDARHSAEPIDNGREPIDEWRVVVDEGGSGNTWLECQSLELAEPEGVAERRLGHDVERGAGTGVDNRAGACQQIGRELLDERARFHSPR